ncbi:MAG: hypothetical protein ABIJ41_02805 [Candidatus Omnitrophota bacterium]
MRQRFLFALAVLFFMAQSASAHPPSEIQLNYNQENQILHIVVSHNTHNLTKHRIRKVIVYLNDQEVLNKNYVKQMSASELVNDIAVQAKPGDIISVKAICSEAGYKQESLIIPQEETQKDKSP